MKRIDEKTKENEWESEELIVIDYKKVKSESKNVVLLRYIREKMNRELMLKEPEW